MKCMIALNFFILLNNLYEVLSLYQTRSGNKASFFFRDAAIPSGPGPPHDRGFTITLTHHTRYNSSRRVISPTQSRLPENTHNLQETDIHIPGGIRTRIHSKRTAADPRLRPRCPKLL